MRTLRTGTVDRRPEILFDAGEVEAEARPVVRLQERHRQDGVVQGPDVQQVVARALLGQRARPKHGVGTGEVNSFIIRSADAASRTGLPSTSNTSRSASTRHVRVLDEQEVRLDRALAVRRRDLLDVDLLGDDVLEVPMNFSS
jgi:hypothetical protein